MKSVFFLFLATLLSCGTSPLAKAESTISGDLQSDADSDADAPEQTRATPVGSPSASPPQASQDQLLREFKADMIATCNAKHLELQKMVTDPTPITPEMCERVAEDLLSEASPKSVKGVFNLILQKKGDQAALLKMKKDLQEMERHFDRLGVETVIARPALLNLIDKMLKS